MTPEEEERGHQLQLARIKNNKMQREPYLQTAEEERKLKNMCLTVTDVCEGEKATQQQMSAQQCMRRLNNNMSATTRQQMSSQQCMRRLKNKIFLHAYCNGDKMTPKEKERGCQLQLAHIKKNKKQSEHYHQTAEEKRKPKIAEEERKLKNMCLMSARGRMGKL